MRAARLLTIMITLQLRGRTTAQVLADKLEVSKRTIYRDIDELSAAGVPIYADRGRGGGLALLDGFRTELTGLTRGETEALILAGLPAAATDLGLASEASAARIKLLASVPKDMTESARRIADRFHLDPLDWYRNPRQPKHLKTVAQCVWENRRLNILYVSWKGTRRSTIEPLGLVLKAGHWYLLAAGRRAPRTYKLESISEAYASDETFDRPTQFDLAAEWQNNVTAFEAGLVRHTATLRVAETASDRLYRLGDVIALPLQSAPLDDRGWRQADVGIESVDHAAGLILGFGDEIEVVSPAALRDEVRRRAAAVAVLYARLAAGGA